MWLLPEKGKEEEKTGQSTVREFHSTQELLLLPTEEDMGYLPGPQELGHGNRVHTFVERM
jgi:hypothetical protein